MMDSSNKSSKGIGDILSALTIAILFLVILLLVVFTASSYQHGTSYQTENDTTRVLCSYVAKSVKNNHGGEVVTTEFDGNQGIRIEDGDTGFAHKIYLHNGDLLEEYSKVDAPIHPDTASKIGETSIFDINYITDDLLEIKTDKGVSYVHVHE